MKTIILFLFPIIGYSQGVDKLQRMTMSSVNEQIVITQRESMEFIGDYNFLKSSLVTVYIQLEECTSELEVLRNISIESSLEIEKLSLENEKLKAEIVDLKKNKKIVTYEK
jgi:hypothetical protein